MTENFLNLNKDTTLQVWEGQCHQSDSVHPGGTQGTAVKLSKVKNTEGILKVAKEKNQWTHKGAPIHLTAGFSV